MAECPTELKPMKDWVQEGKEGEPCRPCMLAPVASWYHEELKERGRTEIAEKLAQVADAVDMEKPETVLTLCEELDKIKETVEEPLRERLKEFDCAAQTFSPDDE